ncbi:unnamed protein product [Leuciscus chuanchicus]
MSRLPNATQFPEKGNEMLHLIAMPRNCLRFIHIKEEFYKIAAFPNVIGTVDCTHIRIQRPSGAHEGDYVNRKSFHSVNVQMICDADCLITNLEAKWPGSVHDSRIFRASRIYQRLSLGEFSGVLLGDKGYACETFLMTPLTDPQTPAQQAYNHAHAKTRARIEMTFGLLKSRFQCLHHLRVSPDRACDIPEPLHRDMEFPEVWVGANGAPSLRCLRGMVQEGAVERSISSGELGPVGPLRRN